MFYAVIGGLWFASIICSVVLGFYLRTLANGVKWLSNQLVELNSKIVEEHQPPKPKASPSSIIDYEDAGEIIRAEHERTMKLLNPDKYE
jgi:hypothetical protein